MNLKLVGFNWELPGNVPITQFEKYLSGLGSSGIKYQGYQRHLHVGRASSLLTGVLITLKSQRKFTTFNDLAKRLTVRDLGNEDRLADFNFFAVNTVLVNGAYPGLYLSYFPSCGVGPFCEFAARRFDDMCRKLIGEAVKAAGNNPAKQKAARLEAERRYKTGMTHSQMVRTEAWHELLKDFAKLRACDLVFDLSAPKATWLYPVPKDLNRQTTRVSFRAGLGMSQVLPQLRAYIDTLGAKEGRFEGEDAGGAERIVKMIDTPDVFATYDYDKHVDDKLIDYADVSRSPMLGMMADEMRKLPLRFGAIP